MKRKVIAIDVDGVLADLHAEWLRRYNEDSGDRLIPIRISDWDITKFVKSGWEKRILEYLEDPSLYDYVLPINCSLLSVDKIRSRYKIIFATSVTKGCVGRKERWLRDNGFLIAADEYVEITDKTYLPADYLIDDYHVNIQSFYGTRGNGCGVSFLRPWNRKYYWPISIDGWEQFLSWEWK